MFLRDVLRPAAKEARDRLRRAGFQHWLGVFAALLLGLCLSHLLQRVPDWQDIRHHVYRALFRSSAEQREEANRTVVVMIDDADHDSVELKRRVPLNREYVAALVTAVRDAGPSVIALDVDLTGPDHFPAETEHLRHAIRNVPIDTTVVLTFTIAGDYPPYKRKAGILDDLVQQPNLEFGSAAVALDRSQFGLSVPLENRLIADAFATAIARAVDPDLVAKREDMMRDHSIFTTFVPESGVEIVSARDVRAKKPKAMRKLAHKIVIIGGNWGVVDRHPTPYGAMSGAVLNTNYVEALLAHGGAKKMMPPAFNIGMEVGSTLVVALICVVFQSIAAIVGWLLLALVLIVATAYFIFQNFGGFFDPSIMLVFVVLHAIYERRGQHAHPKTVWNRGLAYAVTGVLVGVSGLFWQGRHPTALYDPERLAQVASLHLLPSVEKLIPRAPRHPFVEPDVLLASVERVVQADVSALVVPPKLQAVPLTPGRDISIAAQHTPGTKAPLMLPLIAPVQLATAVVIAEHKPAEDAAVRFAELLDARNRAKLPTPREVVTHGGTSQGTSTVLAMTPFDPVISTAPEYVWSGEQSGIAQTAFEDAWLDASRLGDEMIAHGKAADNRTSLLAMPRRRPREPTGPDFESMCRRLEKRAHILSPVRDGLELTLFFPAQVFASDHTLARTAVNALAHTSVELMFDKDLTVIVIARPKDRDSIARRGMVHATLLEMRLEPRRIILSDSDTVGVGGVKMVVSLN